MGKGSDNERKLASIYEEAGYRAYRPATVQWGENDMWNLFDLAALYDNRGRSGPSMIHLVQCKTNRASGITQWFEDAKPFNAVPGVVTTYAVRHDREGWRIAYPDETAQRGYTWLYDGRDSDHCIGDGLTQYLKGNDPA